MRSTTQTGSISSGRLWGGRIMSGLPALFLLFDSVIHLMKIKPVEEAFVQLGYAASLARGLGIIELICLILYVIPRTAVLGAILLTGYLGGAIASNLRIGSPLLSTVLFPIYVALPLWGGLYLRDARLRALIPLRSEQADPLPR